MNILRNGGNAVDAAIAASATLSVVEPHMTGVGGDCFAIVVEPNGAVHGLNGSGRAPAAADPKKLRAHGHMTMPETGALSVTVPGAVKAWQALLQRFGSRSFDEVFAEAIRYAEAGFPVSPRVAWDWLSCEKDLRTDEGAAKHWLLAGEAPKVGQRFQAPALGATLRAITRGGADEFYNGEIGQEIARTIQAKGGALTHADLAQVSVDWVRPISTTFGGLDILELPPNGQGITALVLLRVLEALDVRSHPPSSSGRYHIEIEAARLAYSVRDRLLGDQASMTIDVDPLLSDEFIEGLVNQFDPKARISDLDLPPPAQSNTVYLTVVDRERRSVSFINSIYDAFGSGIVTPKSGFALQNRGACFSLKPGHPNELRPRKRPLHTIMPGMAVAKGRAAISFGVVGGAFQPMGHAHILCNMLTYGMDPQEAVDHPRAFWDAHGRVLLEASISSEIRSELRMVGHNVCEAAGPHGCGQIVQIDDRAGFLIGGSDSRKDGQAIGW
ncbi:gamma-glutamyltransferase family protein [Mesorhizobium sp. RIZ17]|uniref:gamma-glutamyltransferase family protein n=1 Tax=Mesorhizobium sp. RIZ17 TaxID=3132743 RepID=UPI003DA99475